MFRLARLSLANRALVALITLLIAGVGLFSMTSLKQELIPSIEPPQSSVITTLPGASPEVVDEQISLPLSQALKAVPDVEQVVAHSSSSVSQLTVSYAYGTDAAEFKRNLQDAIDGVQDRLPSDAKPEVMSGGTSNIPVMFLTASAPDLSLSELSTKLEDSVVPQIEEIEGVRAASVSGAEVQRITITPDLAALAGAGLTPQSISSLLEANGFTMPVGSITEDGEMLPVQGGTAITNLDELKALPLASTTEPGKAVALSDVAKVDFVTEPQTSITRTNGKTALSMMVTATANGDTVAISHAINDKLKDLTADVSAKAEITVLFDQAPFIEESIQHLAIEGLLGLFFAVVVILVFLLSVRSTLVTAISIPLSVLVTFIGLNIGGYSLNMLTLGALTIAIGRVVDDSIVVIENIKRQLSYGEEKAAAIITGVREVAGAITASTLTTVAVFLPIAFVGGMVGELFVPFAMTVGIAMMSSLLVALTIVPVLSYWFIKSPAGHSDLVAVREAAEAKEHNGLLQRGYKPILRGTQRHPMITLVASVLLLGVTVSLTGLLKIDFLGSTGQNMLTVTQSFEAGTDLETISDKAAKVEDALLDIDGVDDVMLTAGTGGRGLSAMFGGGGGTATYIVNTDKGADQIALKDKVRDSLEKIKDAGDITLPDAGAAGFSSNVDVVVTAANEKDLVQAADEVYAALKDTNNTVEVTTDREAAQPTLQIVVDRPKALQQGLTEMQVVGIVASTLSPQSVGSLRVDGNDYKIFVDAGNVPATTKELEATPLPTAAGMVTLTELAAVEQVAVPSSISRQAGDLVATISLLPNEGELGDVTTSVQEKLDGLKLPAGVKASLGGIAEQQGDAFQQLGLAMLIAIALVYLIMVATFRSLIQPLILLISVPFAATGAIVLLLITNHPLGISALIGMLMLIGIVVTNAIVLIDLVNQYRKQGQNVHDAVFNGARQRLRPILMTALATIFALIPMALGVTGSSGFISQDLAIVVIGGLISSTALTLILVPVLYQLFEGRRERKRAAKLGAEFAASVVAE